MAQRRVILDPPYAAQPWRAAYLTYETLTTICLRFPLWALYYLPSSNRPRTTWTFKRALIVKAIKYLMYVGARVGGLLRYPDHRAIQGGPTVKGVWIEPATELVVGEVAEWAVTNGVACERIPAYWHDGDGQNIPAGAPAAPGEKVVYALHGGAYARQSAHPTDPTSHIPRGFMKYTPAIRRSLTLEYRLTKGPPSSPTNPFPAALLDAIAGYIYLVRDLGFDPANVIVEGDSAGGNLALALVRYLVDNRAFDALPAPPGALVLLSPWVDLEDLTAEPADSSVHTCRGIDFLDVVGPSFNHYADNFASRVGVTNRYISPASASVKISFEGFPRTFVLLGGSEVLRDQIRVLCKRMRADLGEDRVEVVEMPDGIHDFLVFPWFEPERSDALQRISRWIMQ